VNCYYEEGFRGEDVAGWYDKHLAILGAAGQLRWSGHLELAREHMRCLGDKLVLLHPVAHEEVRGARLYRSFLDRSAWPRYMRQGYEHARAALDRIGEARRTPPPSPRRERLGAVDAAWLRMERADNPMTITSAMLFERPIDHAALLEIAERAVRQNPRFRQRIIEPAPSQPTWEPVASVELADHVGRTTLPAPGDDAALRALIGRLASEPLDRRRPLWHIHHAEGYGGGSAVVIRLHHAFGDGDALVRFLLGLTGAGASAVPHPAGRVFRPDEMTKHKGAALKALGHLLALPADPKTSLKAPLGTDKRFAWSAPIPFERLRAIAYPFGLTTNDALLAALSGALARTLVERGELPDGLTVHGVVPVNLRPDEANGALTLGNRFGLVYAPLPIGLADPNERLRRVGASMAELKRSPEAAVTLLILAAIGGLPPPLYDAFIRIFGAKATLVVTNVPGPKEPVTFAGQAISGLLVWAPESSRLGLSVSLLSYAGTARVGVGCDAHVCSEPQRIVDAFVAELDRLDPVAEPRRSARPVAATATPPAPPTTPTATAGAAPALPN
jgi:hypothetical protein